MQSVQASDPGQGAQQRRVGSALGVKGRCHQALDKGPPWLGSCLHRAAQQRFSYTLCPAPGSPCLCAHSRDCLQCLSSLPCHFSPVQPRAPILSFRIYLEHLLLQSLPRCLAGCRDPPSPCSQMAPACTHTRAQTPLLTALPSLQCSCVFMSTSAARLLSLLRARPVSCHLQQTGSLLSIHSPHHRIHSLCQHRGFMVDKQTSLPLYFWVGHGICPG